MHVRKNKSSIPGSFLLRIAYLWDVFQALFFYHVFFYRSALPKQSPPLPPHKFSSNTARPSIRTKPPCCARIAPTVRQHGKSTGLSSSSTTGMITRWRARAHPISHALMNNVCSRCTVSQAEQNRLTASHFRLATPAFRAFGDMYRISTTGTVAKQGNDTHPRSEKGSPPSAGRLPFSGELGSSREGHVGHACPPIHNQALLLCL